MKSSERTFALGFLLAAVVVGWYLWQRQQQAPEKATPLPSPPPVRPPRPGPEPDPDDLTDITGIGPVYAERLRAAGVRTFADLAALAPDAIRAKADLEAWQGDPEAWIEQARELAG